MVADRKNLNPNLTSEYFVASQLLRLGYVVTITLGQTKEIDLLVANPDGRTRTIDVKGLKDTTNWPLKPKLRREEHFFVLVNYRGKLTDPSFMPEVFVVPSLEIETLLSPWSGKPEVTCVEYRKIKGSRYQCAWDLLFPAE